MGKEKGEVSSSSALSSFPVGLHILVVDDDPTCLMVVEKMLRKCKYEVTTCEHAAIALAILRERKGMYDVVLTDVHMPDMDGFKLLELVGLEMDLPVLMMSADCDVNVARKGLEHGACYYLMKPVSMDEIKNIWQHVIRKKKADGKEIEEIGNDGKGIEQTESVEEENTDKKASEDVECASSVNEGSTKECKRKKEAWDDEDDSDDNEESAAQKKPRVIWHSALHSQFLNAVNQIGIDRAVPKKILEIMNVPGITRENVASHLQKYRLFLRRLNSAQQSQRSLSNAFSGKSKFNLVPPLLFDFQGQTGFPKFPEPPYNPMGLQSGLVSNMQNLSAPMPTSTINPMPFLNQDLQCNKPLATFVFGQSMLDGPRNVQPVLLPGSISLGPKPSLLQQNDGKVGFGIVPQHMKMVPSSLVGTMPMTHEEAQARPGLFGSAPLDSSGMQNVKYSNEISNMGNVGSFNRFNQPPPFNYTSSNYSGLHLTSSGGLYGLTQTGPFGQASSNTRSGDYNLLSEINNGKLPLEMEGKDPMLPELSTPDFSSDLFTKLTNLNSVPACFPNVTQEGNDLMMGSCSKIECDSLSNILQSSRFEKSSVAQPFKDADLEDLVFKEQQDGTDLMEPEFDISTFQMDDIDRAK